jgi:hypothetical protein
MVLVCLKHNFIACGYIGKESQNSAIELPRISETFNIHAAAVNPQILPIKNPLLCLSIDRDISIDIYEKGKNHIKISAQIKYIHSLRKDEWSLKLEV